MQKNMVLDLFWTLAQIFIINLHATQSILLPEEREVTINLIDQDWI